MAREPYRRIRRLGRVRLRGVDGVLFDFSRIRAAQRDERDVHDVHRSVERHHKHRVWDVALWRQVRIRERRRPRTLHGGRGRIQQVQVGTAEIESVDVATPR